MAYPRKKDSVVLRELGTESMLYDPIGEKVVRLNSTARRIRELCDGSNDIPVIAARIEDEFMVAPGANVVKDVAQIVGGFGAAGLLAEEA